ncbi:sulfate permease [Alcaligenaceae bacterium LF4-65]|uniref:Sulfate permease n=1 Tax=Zwartia hollandica TaxID=324606 RepID=A0A953NCG8_9BURK|nr:sulfate permease [Zwartia hollandica]MBZ1350760.1 sulfate permease [Zwartia hollandica]
MRFPPPRLPIFDWIPTYDQKTFTSDLLAALIVTLMLIPQSLAYAMLAGLPPEVGLYASIAPLVLYMFFGTSRVLAVGPVAVISLMTAAAIGEHASAGTHAYWQIAITLAFLSGLILLALGLLRLGFLANFLSHSVVSGFITASALLIAANQFKTVMGIRVDGDNFFVLLKNLLAQAPHTHALTFLVGIGTLGFLFLTRHYLKPNLIRLGIPPTIADIVGKACPVIAIGLTTGLTWGLSWDQAGVKVVGFVPQSLPPVTAPLWDISLWSTLFVPALLISIVGFVESVSVGQTLAARKRQRIEPNQELVALGACNLSAAFTGGFPVTGGFARSVVNADSGARTPAAGLMTALGIALTSLLLTPVLFYLPHVTLAATIIIAVLSLVDFKIFTHTWHFARSDFYAAAATLLGTLGFGVEAGLIVGVLLSIGLHLYKTSEPHIAEVGLVPGTEHFRNVTRHHVMTSPIVLCLRIDESLYFANARNIEDRLNAEVAGRSELQHVVLQCSAVNDIDASALESLENIEKRLRDAGIKLHLSEVKGPVMDRLTKTQFLKNLSGQVYLTNYRALQQLDPGTFARAAML